MSAPLRQIGQGIEGEIRFSGGDAGGGGGVLGGSNCRAYSSKVFEDGLKMP
jgi:hypothetical protein